MTGKRRKSVSTIDGSSKPSFMAWRNPSLLDDLSGRAMSRMHNMLHPPLNPGRMDHACQPWVNHGQPSP